MNWRRIRGQYKLRTVDSPETILVDQEAVEILQKKIRNSLSPFEKKVMDMYLRGMDYLQIAESLGKPAKSIDNALQRMRSKVNRSLEIEKM